MRTRAIVVQAKTGRPVQFEWMADARASLLAWSERCGGSLADYVFPSRTDHARPLSTRQYARLVAEWVDVIGLRREEYGTHSLRRTKASIIYKASVTCAQCRFCSAMLKSRIQFAIWASMPRMPWL